MTREPEEADRRARLAGWASSNGFQLLDDGDQEAERLPLFVIQATVDRDVHDVCLGLWEDTDVACFDLRRGSGWDRSDSTGATIAFPYGLPTTLILNADIPEDHRMLSSMPEIRDHPLEGRYEVRSQNAAFTQALLVGTLADWLLEWRDRPPPMSYEVNQDWLFGFASLLPIDLLPDLLDGILGFRDRIPQDVLTMFGR